MNRFSIINTLQKQVNHLQEEISFLEVYLREAMATADMAPPRPSPNPTAPSKPSTFPLPRPTTTPVPRPLYRSGQMVPAPNEGGSNPFYGDPSYPYGNDGIIPYAPHPYYWTPGDYNNPLNPTPFQYPQKPSLGPDHPARYNGRPYYQRPTKKKK